MVNVARRMVVTEALAEQLRGELGQGQSAGPAHWRDDRLCSGQGLEHDGVKLGRVSRLLESGGGAPSFSSSVRFSPVSISHSSAPTL